MKFRIQDPKIKNIIYQFGICFLIFSLIGCDAFVRKFTRKSKKEELPQEEMVLSPEEYKGPNMTKEELYRQYFLYWKSWQDELIAALSYNGNYKKQLGSADEAINNLENLRSLLNLKMQKKLDAYINQLKDLRDSIKKDPYGNNVANNRLTSERIKMDILHDFSYRAVKDYLI